MKHPIYNAHYLAASSPYNILRLLVRNKAAISLRFVPRFINLLFSSLFFYPFNLAEKLVYTRRVRKTAITHPPVFIIGHWRSGTTYMHNLFYQDRSLACPSTYQCLMPGVHLAGKKFLKFILTSFMPNKRPVDNVPLEADLPQEEEFALNVIGFQSYYQALCFPRATRKYFTEYAALRTKELSTWKRNYLFFLKKVSYSSKGKQLIIKNPTNTVRVKILLDMFPGAKFIYLRRDQDQVLNSTFNLYKKLLGLYSFQTFSDEEIEGNLLWLYKETLEGYGLQKETIPKENMIEIEYSDFIREPLAHMEKIYRELKLDGFIAAKQDLERYIETQKEYKPNTERFLKRNLSGK